MLKPIVRSLRDLIDVVRRVLVQLSGQNQRKDEGVALNEIELAST